MIKPSASDIILQYLTGLPALASRPRIVGMCGSQGSGKSFVAGHVATSLAGQGLACAVLSLDDLYLSKADRARLAHDVHPLLATRGPPGTHDVALGLSILEALRHGRPTSIPVFDKLADDRLPEDRWKRVTPPLDFILFEGWCVGATPQPQQALVEPLNALERQIDVDGAWRAYVNTALAGPYRLLFDQIDTLVMLKAPSFEIVQRWRLEQEATNAATRQADDGKAPMSEAQIAQFIQYYERITRHMLAETPRRADLVISLDEHRQVTAE